VTTGAPKRYYRLSYKKQGSPDSDLKYIDADLRDTKVDKLTLTSSDQFLGPQTVNGMTTLYEVRNRSAYYWYNPDWIGSWWTPPVEDDTNTYVLRLESVRRKRGLPRYRIGSGGLSRWHGDTPSAAAADDGSL
jgi:hypothetical protein